MKEAKTGLVQQDPAFTVDPAVITGVKSNDAALDKLKEGKPQLLIRTTAGEAEAHRLLTAYQDYGDAIAAKRDAALRPLLDEEKVIRERAKVHLVPIASALDVLQRALKDNHAWKEREAERAQSELNAAHEKAAKKEEARAEKRGEEPRPIAPPPQVVQPDKTVVIDDRARTFVDHWVPTLAGVQKGQEENQTAATLPDFAARFPALFTLDWKTICAVVRSGKGTNPYGAPIEVVNDKVLATKKA